MLTIVATVLVLAQLNEPRSSQQRFLSMPVYGVIRGVSRIELGGLRVQLVNRSLGHVISESRVGLDGGFLLRPQEEGFYELKVVNLSDAVIHSQDLDTASSTNLTIELKQRLATGEASISTSRLSHKVPKAAMQEFKLAQKAFERQSRDEAIRHMEAAVTIDSLFFDALASLGGMYLQKRDMERSLRYLEAAKRLDANEAVNNANFAAWHFTKNDFPKAEAEARLSLRSNPNYSRAHYLLAVSLLQQGKLEEDARRHLSEAAKAFVPARALLNSLTQQAEAGQSGVTKALVPQPM